ncbi:MAG: sugar MFS transporter [Hymenobacteraceae bacterium]|nr:sugar MFS transporter [Hymenobacteraceae bacterium]
MALAAPQSTASVSSVSASAGAPRYGSALASLTVLFFMMGFITCLNDILIPYLKAIFQLTYTQANLINLCFFGAYFFASLPAGKLVERVGYKRGMLLGFLIAAAGCFLFYPAADSRTYPLFLGALFVLATGVVLLQVAGNPYVSILGRPESASARLTLTQAFNSLGTFLAPQVGTALILSRLPKEITNVAAIDVTAVQLPYLVIGGVLVLISLVLSQLRLPAIEHAPLDATDAAGLARAWHYRHLAFGVAAIFAYVGAGVAIGSHIVSYLAQPGVMGLSTEAAGYQVKYYWGAAMVGRFLGTYLLGRIQPGRLLAMNALGSVVLVAISAATRGEVAMWSLLAIGLMNSLMFPTIFTLAVAGLGRLTEEASGLLCTAIVGGALVPVAFGAIADNVSLRMAFILPVLCYAFIAWYGLNGSRRAVARAAA